jgi:short-subunit dehydrogenase
MPTALITGATSGIGRAFAARLHRRGYDLTLVARTTADLDEVAATLQRPDRPVRVLAADLADSAGRDRVAAALTRDVPDLLVNNAGIGLAGAFPFTDPAAERGLLEVNVMSVLHTTQAALPGMLRRGSGAVVNVASVAGCGPAWLASTYPASKAWVLAFTESTARSAVIRRSGVRLMALLPGYTRTAFHARAHMVTGHLPAWLWLSTDQVVDAALRDLDRGRTVSIPSLRYRAAAWALRHAPHRVSAALAWDFSTGADTSADTAP